MKILIDQNECNESTLHLKHERHVPHIDFNNILGAFYFAPLRLLRKHIKTSCRCQRLVMVMGIEVEWIFCLFVCSLEETRNFALFVLAKHEQLF